MWKTVTWFIKNLFFKITRTLQFARLGWKDRDFDYAYLLELMRWKLDKMSLYFKDANIVEGSLETSIEIRKAVEALDRYNAADYYPDEYAAIDTKWGDYCFNKIEGRNASTMSRTNIKTPEDEEECSKQFRAWYDKEEAAENKDWALFFDTMRDQMKGWWD